MATARQKPRILFDLSFAARGYCGIAQDVRLLYRALASRPELDVTGLIYLPQRMPVAHRFLPANAHPGDRLANQSSFLWNFNDERQNWPPFKSMRLLKELRELAALAFTSRVQFDPLETRVFWDWIWRMLFSPTLSAADIPLVQNGKFLLSNLSDGIIHARVLLGRRKLKLDTRDFDYLIVQDPRPLRLSSHTLQIVRYHDLIPVLRPDTMKNPWHIHWHHRSIREHGDRSLFVCNSQPTRDDLTAAYPELRSHSTTIPNILSDSYYPDPRGELVAKIIERRRSLAAGAPQKSGADCPRYVMSVSTLEPRKNFVSLIAAFNLLKERARPGSPLADLKLLIVGSPGWKFEPILSAMREPIQRGDLVHLEKVPTDELRVLYSHAQAFAFVSNYEGFGFPPLEAMQCGTPAIVSDISTHRWVVGDAA
ncbi:MAG TPA: glycosyltransferase family 1 protein, partial [Pirellulales bacterium]|nr:glycosyltransferase family 1 protein [Pirellulales bacterium]